jgi:3-methyl-2-oxobutanoate hydroxymethyltransferase
MKDIYTFGVQPAQRSLTIPDMREAKANGQKLVQTYAGTFEELAAVEKAGLDMLICDSAHAQILRDANQTTFTTVSMKMTELPTIDDIFREAFRVLHLGVDAVITPRSAQTIEALAREGIPVMGHMGLVPRKSILTGGLRAAGKTATEATELFKDFKRLEDAGAFAVECEVITAPVMEVIAKNTGLICISLGSGSGGDVHHLFLDDICGESAKLPRHARVFGEIGPARRALEKVRIDALVAFKNACTDGSFPMPQETASMPHDEYEKFLENVEKLI